MTFWTFQGTVATCDRRGGQSVFHVKFSQDLTYQKLLKSVNFWQLFLKIARWTFGETQGRTINDGTLHVSYSATPPPVGWKSIVMSVPVYKSLCLCVSPPAYLRYSSFHLYQIFVMLRLAPLRYAMYFRYISGVIFAYACIAGCSEWRRCVVARRITPLLRRIGCVVS